MTPRLGCRDLRVSAHAVELLYVPALDVPAGGALAVLGPNGAGKSTLLRALGLLSRHRCTGEVLLDGHPATPKAMRDALAAVLQRPLLRRGTVAANVATGLRLRGIPRAEAARRAAPWLAALGVAHLAERDARGLSGGEAQRVAIARALAVAPRVLLLDEPFVGLDATTRTDLLADLRAVLDGLDTATVFVTHDRHEATALAERTALLVAGRIRQQGATATVLDHPADPECARLVGYSNLFPGPLAARPERCRVLPPDAQVPSDTVTVCGTLRRAVPLGGVIRFDVRTTSGDLSCFAVDGQDRPAGLGSDVVVAVDRAHVRPV